MSNQAYLTSNHKKNINNASQMKDSADFHVELHSHDDNCVEESQDWMAMKVEIDNLLQTSKSGYELLKKSKEVSDYWSRVRDQRKKLDNGL